MRRMLGPAWVATLQLATATPVALSQEPAPSIAFVNVAIVPMLTDEIIENQTVIVRDGRIERIGPTQEITEPPGATVVDGRGRYLMPGLADMHVHIWSSPELILFIGNGVTTVRNMWGAPIHFEWQNSLMQGQLVTPHIYTAGPLIDGSPPIWPGSAVVETPEAARRVVAEQAAAGYDFIKVYTRLKPEVYQAIVEAASANDIRVVGHVPQAVGLWGVLAAEQATIEHFSGTVDHVIADTILAPNWREGLSGIERWEKLAAIGAQYFAGALTIADVIDSAKLAALIARTRDAGTWNVPTNVVYPSLHLNDTIAFFARPEMRYVDPTYRNMWRESVESRASWASADMMENMRFWNRVRNVRVKIMYDAGARILLGTDTPNPWVVPGFAIHEELSNFVSGGMTPYEALRTGTYDAHEFLGSLDSLGTVEPGKIADLILLEANPIADVANVRRRVGVMLRGRWFAEEDLQDRMNAYATSINPGN